MYNVCMVQIILAIALAAVILPVVLFAAAQRWSTISPRLGRWMDERATRVSPRLGSFFRDETRERND